MIAFLAIVKLTLKSVVRSHIFQLLLLILLFTIIVLPISVKGDGTAQAQIQVSLKYCLGIVSFILSVSSIWLGCFTMGQDIENHQIHMVLSKPVSRVFIWFAKFTGILLINTILLSISALLVYILIICQFHDPVFLDYIKWPLGIIIGISILICAIILFIWLNRYILNFFRIRFIKSDNKQYAFTSLLWKSCLVSFVILIISVCTWFALVSQFEKKTFSEDQRQKIQNEVLVARRVFMPVKPDIEKIAQEEYNRRISQLLKKYGAIPEIRKKETMFDIRKQLTANLGEVRPGTKRYWFFEGLNYKNKSPLFIRYRPYIGKVSTRRQRQTMGSWAHGAFISEDNDSEKPMEMKKLRFFWNPTSYLPQKMMCGIFNEQKIPAYQKPMKGGNPIYTISPDGKAAIGFMNLDPRKQAIFFQSADGPQLLMKVTGFLVNYSKGILIIFLKLFFVTGIACAFGAIISTPVAIFTVFSYIIFGTISSYLLGYEHKMQADFGPVPGLPLLEQIGAIINKILTVFIIPMQKFEVSPLLSGGELIEWSYVFHVFIYNVILRGLPIVFLGIWCFRKREMGLVIKK